jgi:hypothetical protein
MLCDSARSNVYHDVVYEKNVRTRLRCWKRTIRFGATNKRWELDGSDRFGGAVDGYEDLHGLRSVHSNAGSVTVTTNFPSTSNQH